MGHCHVHAHTHTHTRARAQTHTRTHTHTHGHTHTHTHTHGIADLCDPGPGSWYTGGFQPKPRTLAPFFGVWGKKNRFRGDLEGLEGGVFDRTLTHFGPSL